MQAGVFYSFGVFFKPVAANFNWNRALTSGVHSVLMLNHGFFAVPIGWLADRFGPAKVMVFCGFLTGLGLILTSQINALWQFYLTYGLVVGIGVSGGMPITTGTTARWFVKRRGLALGIVSAGVGLGTLIILPMTERLIAAFEWSTAYFILGIASWIVMIMSAAFLRRDPEGMGYQAYGMQRPLNETNTGHSREISHVVLDTDISTQAAVRTRPLWLLFCTYFLFSFCVQMIMVHLVNYATDLGIISLVAATLLSMVGIGSMFGRLAMGAASDRIGSSNALAICCLVLGISLLWLIFVREIWMFYLFAIIFGFAYGGEVPQMAALVGQLFGLRSVSALVGVVLIGLSIGGALGSLMGGRIFDLTDSYQVAFIIAVVVSVAALILVLMLKRARPAVSN
jgi:MFS family permease